MRIKQLREKVLSKPDCFINANIKIQGSVFDKKRKLSDKDIKTIKRMRKKGISLYKIAKEFNVSTFIIYYHTNKQCREKHLKSRNGIHYGTTVNYTLENRVERKRDLISSGLVDDQVRRIKC